LPKAARAKHFAIYAFSLKTKKHYFQDAFQDRILGPFLALEAGTRRTPKEPFEALKGSSGSRGLFFWLGFLTFNKLSAYSLTVKEQSGDIESQQIDVFFRVTL
jgi:hypothetical protein